VDARPGTIANSSASGPPPVHQTDENAQKTGTVTAGGDGGASPTG
jgi:hypothetical protein